MTNIAVGFDFDHTLGIDNHLERNAFGLLAAQLGTPIDIDEKTMNETLEGLLVPFRAAEETMDVMMSRFAEALPQSAEVRRSSGAELAGRFRQICYDLVDKHVQPIEGAHECIAGLVADGIPVGIYTNGWSELQERKVMHALGEFPGPILVSESQRAYKPSLDAFSKLEKALGVGPSGLWYVGDNPVNDIAGARAYGIRAVWLNRYGQTYPEHLTPPTATILHLHELAAIVRGA